MNPANRHYQQNRVKAEDEAILDETNRTMENRVDATDVKQKLAKQREQEESKFRKSGFLLKQGEKNKAWKKRFFEIDIYRHVLTYAAEDSFGLLTAIGEIPLLDSKCEFAKDRAFENAAFVFCITPKDSQRFYILQAESEEERQAWFDMIRLQLDFVDKEATIKEGFLRKEGENVKSWKKRYMCLTKYCLSYRKNEADTRPTGVINLRGGARVKVADKDVGQEFAMTILPFSTTRPYHLAACSQEELTEWLDAIRAVVGDKTKGGVVHVAPQQYDPDEEDRGSDAEANDEEMRARFRAVRLLASHNDTDLGKTGHLLKMGAKVKNWKRRLFTIDVNAHELVYQSVDSLGLLVPLGTIPLVYGAAIEKVPDELHGGKKFLFSIHPEGCVRAYVLQAETAQERTEWMDILKIHADTARWAESDQTPLKTGGLLKQGANNKGWKKRHFVVRVGKIEYFKKEGAKRPAGIIDLSHGARVQKEDFDQYEQEFCFSVTPSHEKRTYAMIASSTAECKEWIGVIADALRRAGKAAPIVASASTKKTGSDKKSVHREGHLTKMGEQIRNWKKRWIVLDAQVIKYFKAEKDKRPAGTIDLTRGVCVLPVAVDALHQEHCFSITVSGSKRSYIMVAETAEDCAGWMADIQRASHSIPLPAEWKQMFDAEGASSFVNSVTGKQQQQIPRPLY